MQRYQSSSPKEPSKAPISSASKPNALASRPFAVPTPEEGRSPTTQPQEAALPKFSAREPGRGRSLPIQPKLTIGAPGDKYEQEADRVAQQVVMQLHQGTGSAVQPSPQQKNSPQYVHQLQCRPVTEMAIDRDAASQDLESAIHRARGTGQPLDAGLQQSMGQVMQADFSGVKVHTDVQADRLNQSIQAKAFTTGQDVFFRQGAYQPGSRGGQELIAHELTHVVQQQGGVGQGMNKTVSPFRLLKNTVPTVLQRFCDKDGDTNDVDAARIASATLEELQEWASRPETDDWEIAHLVPTEAEKEQINARIAELQAPPQEQQAPTPAPQAAQQPAPTAPKKTKTFEKKGKAPAEKTPPPLGSAFMKDLPKHGQNKTRSFDSTYPHVSILMGQVDNKKGIVKIQDFHYSVGASDTHLHWTSQGAGKYKLSIDASNMTPSGKVLLEKAYTEVSKKAARYNCQIERPAVLDT